MASAPDMSLGCACGEFGDRGDDALGFEELLDGCGRWCAQDEGSGARADGGQNVGGGWSAEQPDGAGAGLFNGL